MVSGQVSYTLKRLSPCCFRHSKQIKSLEITLIEFVIFLKFEMLILKNAQLTFFLSVQNIVHPFNMGGIYTIYEFWLCHFVVDLCSLSH